MLFFETVWKFLDFLGTILGVFWDMFGTFLGHFWENLGTCWEHFRIFWGTIGKTKETHRKPENQKNKETLIKSF